MLFASILGDLFGQACLIFIIIIWAIVWLVSKVAQNPEVQDAAVEGFWAWFFSR